MTQIINSRGDPVAADDPARLIWYGSRCGYWTDDWATLVRYGPGIPCCPVCGSPGMEYSALEWHQGVAVYAATHPGYTTFIEAIKNRCLAGHGGIRQVWEAVLRKAHQQAAPESPFNPTVEEWRTLLADENREFTSNA